MNEMNTWNISTQQIQIFLKAVELRNFTKVATYFNFTPSMVSKTITSMEDELEITLFSRKPHELTPTPAGKMLAEDWRQLIGSINNSIVKARSYQNEAMPRIILGFVDSSERVDCLIRKCVMEYQAFHPEMRIIVEKHDMHRAAELLNFGMLDIIFTSAIEVPYLDEHHLPWEKVFETTVSAYVPSGNVLFDRETLELSDLKNHELISLDLVMHPSYNTWLNNLCQKYGFFPNIVSTYRTVRSLLFSLKMQKNIFVGETITSEWCDEALKEFTFPENSFTLLAWRNNHNRAVIEFKNYLKNTLQL